MTKLWIAIVIIVVANAIIAWMFFRIKNKDKEVADIQTEDDGGSSTGSETADGSESETDNQGEGKTDTEPMNGDPSVLTPTDEQPTDDEPPLTDEEVDELTNAMKENDNPPFFFEEGEWYECIAPYEDFVVGQKYQCTEHGRLDGYLIKQPNAYFKPCEAPEEKPDPIDDDEFNNRLQAVFDGLVDWFSKVVPVDADVAPLTHACLFLSFTELYCQAALSDEELTTRHYKRENFPDILDVYGDKENPLVIEEAGAMLFYCILTELVPQKRQQLAEAALTYVEPIKDQELYGWDFYSDPNNARKMAFVVYSYLRRSYHIDEMRHELGSEPISYKKDISELFLDFSKIMPPAAGPYLEAYKNRPNGKPAGHVIDDGDLQEDWNTEKYVAENYTLDAKDKEIRQQTIQAIANKDHHLEHLFGKDRKVKDAKYGTMVFHPVYGHQTLGVEISDSGAVAALANAVGMPCSNNRKSLLNAEYGRRRPGQGAADPSAEMLPMWRALVNFAIEDGDGHRTGYYDRNGDYVDDQGNHIGDYEQYYQGQLYANSYPSGHSAYIMGIEMALICATPELTDKIMVASEWFRLSRVITRYHHLSDTTIGQLCGGMFVPVLFACTNIDLDQKIDDARSELGE